jgi:hypothetical protein
MEAATIIPRLAPRPRNNRSAVSNGRRTFAAEADGRSVWTRRWRDLVIAHLVDLGGEEIASAAQVALARQAATLEIELEKQEAIPACPSQAMELFLTDHISARHN